MVLLNFYANGAFQIQMKITDFFFTDLNIVDGDVRELINHSTTTDKMEEARSTKSAYFIILSYAISDYSLCLTCFFAI